MPNVMDGMTPFPVCLKTADYSILASRFKNTANQSINPNSWSSNRETTEQQCPSCAAELTEASVWMITASEADCMG